MTIASMVAVSLGVTLVPQSVHCIQLPNVVYRLVVEVTSKESFRWHFSAGCFGVGPQLYRIGAKIIQIGIAG
ncbi:hypothetical protein NKI12_30720 [Mesorhizobium australicum]|uniref:Uncharacterized protein n=1 Tax=Mesorhizobium australicum TaxID=536018 RepID=A0ACC6T911_9HYPH